MIIGNTKNSTYKFDNLEDINQSLKKHKQPQLIQYETDRSSFSGLGLYFIIFVKSSPDSDLLLAM